MPTLRLDLAYDGSGFRGYARQEGHRTVQAVLEDAIETVLRVPVETAVAGRTDAGVHARRQVVSIRVEEPVDAERLARSINGLVGPEMSVMAVTEVEQDFHARFSASWRKYRYEISTASALDPLTRGVVWHVGQTVDAAAMAATAAEFEGEHDFSAFCRTVEGKSNVRHVDETRWEVDGDQMQFWIQANAFCHQMVRALVGLSYDVGRGFTSIGSVRDIIESRDRGRVATIAPPHGLTLWEVGY
ncbi:MAG: tRNA pseudouridine(38-40) synthase TruA [Actinomycetota bacterium]|nr:tRNA pseudouridine(38-40) synthase TruA [Actinomycetota bacterium]